MTRQEQEERDAINKAMKMLDDCKPGECNNEIYLVIIDRYWQNLKRSFQISNEDRLKFEYKFEHKSEMILQ